MVDPKPAATIRDGATPPSTPAARGVAALELAAIAHRLGHRWALRGVSLRVQPGEVVAVVGHNGSGKTTLLRVVATVLTPMRGTGSVFGHDLREDADGVRDVTAMLSHATGLYDDLTAVENLRFAMQMWGMPAPLATILGTLDAVGLLKEANERVRTFSSGMQRRVALARLMLRPPRLLLLDEPYNAFDVAGVALVDGLIRDTVRRGGAALVVTHDLERGDGLFDRLVGLEQGRLSDQPMVAGAAAWRAGVA